MRKSVPNFSLPFNHANSKTDMVRSSTLSDATHGKNSSSSTTCSLPASTAPSLDYAPNPSSPLYPIDDKHPQNSSPVSASDRAPVRTPRPVDLKQSNSFSRTMPARTPSTSSALSINGSKAAVAGSQSTPVAISDKGASSTRDSSALPSSTTASPVTLTTVNYTKDVISEQNAEIPNGASSADTQSENALSTMPLSKTSTTSLPVVNDNENENTRPELFDDAQPSAFYDFETEKASANPSTRSAAVSDWVGRPSENVNHIDDEIRDSFADTPILVSPSSVGIQTGPSTTSSGSRVSASTARQRTLPGTSNDSAIEEKPQASESAEDMRRMREEILAKRELKKRRKELEDDKVLVGTKVGEDHVNYILAYNMLTGIRVAVSRTTAKLDRELTDSDFTAKHKLAFDM